MKTEILDENLEPKIEPKLFEAAFSIEGLLFALLFSSAYWGYFLGEFIGVFCMVVAVPISSAWQILGSILWQKSFISDNWRTYHLLFWVFMIVIFFLYGLGIINLDFSPVYVPTALWNLASLAYICICFFRKKLL